MTKTIDEVIRHPAWRKVAEVHSDFVIEDARVVTGRFGECVKLDLIESETGERFSVSLGVSSARQQLVDYFASMNAEPVGPCRFQSKTIESGQWIGSEYWDIVPAGSIESGKSESTPDQLPF